MANPSFTRDEKRIISFMAMIQFCLIVDFMILMPLGPQMMRTFDISAQSFGFLVSAYTFGAGIMGIVASFFLDRQDRKKSLALFFLGFIFGNLACALVDRYDFLLVTRFITGAFGGVVGSIIYAIVSDAIALERRSTALGIVMASFALASILGVPFCLFLSNHYGWHSCFVAIFIFGSGLWLIFLKFFPQMRGHLDAGKARVRAITQIKGHFSDPNRVWALLFMALLILGHFTINPFLFPSVVSNAQVPETKLPLVYLFGGGASIFASIAFGKVADRFGNHRVFTLAAIASFGAILWVTHLHPMPIAYVIGAVTSFFVIMGGRITPATTLITSTCSPETRGSFLSLVGSVQQLSAALAAFISGAIVTKLDNGQLQNFEIVGYVAIGFTVLAILVSTKIRVVEGSAKP